jgi:ADP-heptose:LPS heptosyltransferase
MSVAQAALEATVRQGRAVKKKYIFEFARAPGDVLMLTALVRDLKLSQPDTLINVQTPFPGLWRHNPYLSPISAGESGVQRIVFNKPKSQAADAKAIGRSRRGEQLHYVTAFHRAFEERTGVHVPVLFPHPDLHLSSEEQNHPLLSGRYWVVVPGGKTDMTTKWWIDSRWQEVVDQLAERGIACVQEGCTKKMHVHRPLRNVRNLVGQTSIRDMIVNIHHAEGVICGCTLQMHIAAALQKPCVVLLGGREEPSFEAYRDDYDAFGPTARPTRVPHQVLHTIGQLDCCRTLGCWRRRVVPLRDERPKYDRSLCADVVHGGGDPPRPKCMDMITSAQVVQAALSYYADEYLLPLGTATASPPVATAASPVATPVSPGPPPAMPPLPAFLRESELQQGLDAVPATPRSPKTVIIRDPQPLVLPPVLGDQVTIFALLYGNDVAMHQRCLKAITASTPPEKRQLRVIANQVGDGTRKLIEAAKPAKVYWNGPDILKFQAMRQAFHDPRAPITTNWVVWMDDVAFPCHPGWLQIAADVIARQSPAERVGLLGEKLSHILVNRGGRDPRDWFRKGSWFADKLFRNRQGTPAHNGNCVHYASANFFLVSRQAIADCDLPDPRLRQCGGGVVIGEQLHQQGYQIKAFNIRGDYVRTSNPPGVRGIKEPYPWT